MGRIVKILVGVVVVLVIAVVAVLVVVANTDLGPYKGMIAEEASKATGRKLTLDGDLKLEVSLNPAVSVEGVTFANAEWGSRPDMATLGRLTAEVQLLPLLTGNVRVNRLVLSDLDLLLETDAQGKGNWEFGEPAAAEPKAESGGATSLPVVQDVAVKNLKVTYKDGVAKQTTVIVLDSLTAAADSLSDPLKLGLKGSFNDQAFSADGTFGSTEALMAGGPLPVAFTAKALGATVKADGRVEDFQAVKGLDLALAVSGDDLNTTLDAARGFVPALKDLAVPPVGPYDVKLRVAGSLEALALSGLAAVVGTPDLVKVTATGAVADLMAQKGIDVTVGAEGRDLNKVIDVARPFVPELKDMALPSLGAFSAKATAKGDMQAMALSGIDVALGQPEFAAVKVSGAVADVLAQTGLDVTVGVEAAELTRTIQQARTLSPELDSALKDVLADRSLPNLGPLNAKATIKGSAQAPAIGGIDVALGRVELARVAVTGGVQDAKTGKGADINLDVQGQDLKPLYAALGMAAPVDLPIDVRANVSDPGGAYRVKDLNAHIGSSDLAGEITVVTKDARPLVVANLTSKLLDIDELAPPAQEPSTTEKAKAAAKDAMADKKGGDKVFPSDPLPLDAMKAADARLTFRGATIKARGIPLTDVAVDLTLKNGRLAVAPAKLGVSDGTVVANVSLDGGAASPPLAVDVKVNQVDYGKLLKTLDLTDISQGKVDANIDVKGAGGSVAAIMASLNGRARIVTEGGKIDSQVLNVVSSDLVAALPFVDSKGDKEIRCGVIDFDIAKGVAQQRAIVFETGGMTLIGEGDVDLGKETLNLAFDPRAKKVSLLKVAMVPFDVGGTLASPSVVPNVGSAAVGAVTGAVDTVAGVAKGGVSAIGDLVSGDGKSKNKMDDTDYCKPALAGEKVKKKTLTSLSTGGDSGGDSKGGTGSAVGDVLKKVLPGGDSAKTPAKTDGGATATAPAKKDGGVKGALEGVGNKIGGGLKGLLGN